MIEEDDNLGKAFNSHHGSYHAQNPIDDGAACKQHHHVDHLRDEDADQRGQEAVPNDSVQEYQNSIYLINKEEKVFIIGKNNILTHIL